MKTKTLFKIVLLLASLLGMVVPAAATTYNVYVTPDGDKVFNWDKSSSYVYTWWDVAANPNKVAHYYDYDNRSGSYQDTALSFNLTGLGISVAEIVSATFNFNILEIWASGRDDVGSFSGGGTVLYSGGTGLKSFDVTNSVKGALTSLSTTVDYSLNHTGSSGFVFGSAEGEMPAFLQITTSGATPAQIPEPATLLLASLGLLGVALARKTKA